MKISFYCSKIIEYSFYLLFLLVPLIFSGSTSELFELNKMWLTYGFTILIIGVWLIDMVSTKKIFIRRTPLDLPLFLFLVSQIISTIYSLDSHVSFFGFYSRFNGGLLSTFCYYLMFYALITYFDQTKIYRLIKTILISGLIVALWGLPSHFGYDPTCYLFRGELNVSCWTEAFKPTIRIFSTLGQPAWLAAYLAVLLPLSMTMFIKIFVGKDAYDGNNQVVDSVYKVFKNNYLHTIYYLLLTILFYISLLYTGTRAGFIGFWLANLVFWTLLPLKRILSLKNFITLFVSINLLFFILNFFIGTPIGQLNKLTFSSFKNNFVTEYNQNIPQTAPIADLNITNSADIRRIVWKGAINAWKAYPLFGSGVETFAFAYYKFRPAEHNLTSEWDYLYNKAHNEYLNYLTTTGIFGLSSYLLFIGLFIIYFLKSQNLIHLEYKKNNNSANLKQHKNENSKNETYRDFNDHLLEIGLFSGWLSILVTNFFGFSVVITNLLLFLIPGFILINKNRSGSEKMFYYPTEKSEEKTKDEHITITQYSAITGIVLMIGIFMLILFRHWYADSKYALGINLSRSNYLQEGYYALDEAVKIRPNEPIFQDELSMTSLQISLLLFQQNEATTAATFAQNAIDTNSLILANHPNYLPFWKSRVRLFYALGELVPEYKKEAVKAAEQTALLAPTDAKIAYNLGILYGQINDYNKAIKVLNKTIALKSDYQDAYYALALLYHEMANDKESTNTIELQKKAEEILTNLIKKYPDNTQAKNKLTEWSKMK